MEENTKKMLAGLPYRPDTEELSRISTKAHRLSRDYNQTADEDKEVRNIKKIISNIEELMDALAELKTNYEEKLT